MSRFVAMLVKQKGIWALWNKMMMAFLIAYPPMTEKWIQLKETHRTLVQNVQKESSCQAISSLSFSKNLNWKTTGLREN